MGQKMTWQEIRNHYPESFVLLDDCEEEREADNKILITKGKVVFATKDGKVIYDEYCRRGQHPHMTFGHTHSDKLELEEISFMESAPIIMPEIPFRLEYGLLYISVTLLHKGKGAVLDNCIFDTGSAGTVFDCDEVSKIGIHANSDSSLKRLKMVGGYQTVFVSSVDQLQLGPEFLASVEIEVGNLHSKFGVQGIIGTDVMQHYDWGMRFSDKRLSFKK